MKTTFTPEQSALVERVWLAGGSIKPYLGELGDRPYTTVVSHALKTLKLGPRPKSDRGLQAYAWDSIKTALESSQGTTTQVSHRTRLYIRTVNKFLCAANAGPGGQVHVIDWEKRSNGGKPVPVYALGPGENAPIPAPLTVAEKNKRARSRRKGARNPWLSVAGLVEAPQGATGRIYAQDMTGESLEHRRRAA